MSFDLNAAKGNSSLPQQMSPVPDPFSGKMLPGKITIESVTFSDVGTYDQQLFRPLVCNPEISQIAELQSVVQRTPPAEVANNLFSSIGINGLLLPSPNPVTSVAAEIAGGWGNKRLRFMIRASKIGIGNSKVTFYIQGFTDHTGILNSAIDPRMVFTINSITKTVLVTEHSPTGGWVQRERTVDCSHLITAQAFNINQNGLNPGMLSSMRPQDVFGHIQLSDIRDPLEEGGNQHGDFSNSFNAIYDTRSAITDGEIKMSKRNHAVPTSYLDKISNAYVTARTRDDGLGSDADILQNSKGLAKDTSYRENEFIMMLSSVADDNRTPGSFTWKNILDIEPTIQTSGDRVQYHRVSGAGLGMLYNAGQMANWYGRDHCTHMASVVATVLPGIMSNYNLQVLAFSATNSAVKNDFTHKIEDTIVFTKANSLDQTVNIGLVCEAIKPILSRELLSSISMNHQINYTLIVECNMSGETRINIKVNNEAPVDYCSPTYADGIFTAMITPRHQDISALSSGIKNIIDNIGSSLNPRELNTFNYSPLNFGNPAFTV